MHVPWSVVHVCGCGEHKLMLAAVDVHHVLPCPVQDTHLGGTSKGAVLLHATLGVKAEMQNCKCSVDL